MKEKLLALWAKLQQTVSDNRETVIRATAATIGLAVGVIGATIISTMQEEELLNSIREDAAVNVDDDDLDEDSQ